jgi:hypothetical protein
MHVNDVKTRRKPKWKKIVLWVIVLVVAIPVVLISALIVKLGMWSKPEVSDDITALRAEVSIPEQTTSARWEIFFTPEFNGVPAPTDYVSLIAELQTNDREWSFSQETSGRYPGIVPEAARPWLSPWFRPLIAKYKNTKLKITSEPGCRLYQSRMTKSGRKVDGFVCVHERQALLYLILDRPPEEEMLRNQNQAE